MPKKITLSSKNSFKLSRRNLVRYPNQPHIEKEAEEFAEKSARELKQLKEDVVGKDYKIESLNKFRLEKEQYLEEIRTLKQDLEKERAEHKKDVQNRDRQMFDATERLKKEMLNKIKETKAQLMALNDEQLNATTRLTILQNHQLTTELEYQSKQTEKLILSNDKLEEQLTVAKRDLEIHKQVENEMAKRSHFYQKAIHKYNAKLKAYEQKEKDSAHAKSSSEYVAKSDTDELITFLEGKLEEADKKYAAFHNDYEILQADYKKLQELLSRTKDKYGKAALLLTEFLDNILSASPNILEDQKNYYLDVERL